MAYYQQITLQPDAEVDLYFLWSKVYAQVHLALVESQKRNGLQNVGVSFPDYSHSKNAKTLGTRLNLFANNVDTLNQLGMEVWLQRLTQFIELSDIKSVTETVQETAIFKRIQLKTNKERLARRRAKRHKQSFEEALSYFMKMDEMHSDLPFIQIKSESSNQRYPIFIEKITTTSDNNTWQFSTYGLSNDQGLPIL